MRIFFTIYRVFGIRQVLYVRARYVVDTAEVRGRYGLDTELLWDRVGTAMKYHRSRVLVERELAGSSLFVNRRKLSGGVQRLEPH